MALHYATTTTTTTTFLPDPMITDPIMVHRDPIDLCKTATKENSIRE